jgi:NADPH:quinone reductase
MKAIVVHEYGEPEVLQLEDVSDPTPGEGQVIVKIHAAGVNPVETYRRAGKAPYNVGPMPFTPGSDGAGEIAAVGPNAGSWKVGDRVYTAKSLTGTYAELALCKASEVFRLPHHVSFEQGAALGVPYATAHRALFGKAGAKKGETVFVHGATGGVGTAAIQLAKAAGLTVAGSAGSSQGEAFLESLGVRYTCNHNQPDYLSDALGMTCGRGFDIILEMLANVNLGHDPQVLAPRGRIVVVGNRGSVEVNPRDWMSRDAVIYAMTLMNVTAEELTQIHAEIGAGLEKGELKPIIDQEFALADAAKAHIAVMESGSRGKVVLKP